MRKIDGFCLVLFSIIFFDASAQLKVSSSGDVGLGVENPLEKLHIDGNIRGNQLNGAIRIGTLGGYWLDLGPRNSGFAHIKTDRQFFYFNTGLKVQEGLIGSYDGDLKLRTSDYNRLVINSNSGFVGIGTTAPNYKLDVHGDIGLWGAYFASDERLKNDIKDIDERYLTNIFNLKAKTYFTDYSPMMDDPELLKEGGDTIVGIKNNIDLAAVDTVQKIGFIAQDVIEYYPNLVKKNEKGFYSIDYVSLIPVLVEVVKAQQAELSELKRLIYSIHQQNSKALSTKNAVELQNEN